MRVPTALKNRGIADILIAVADGLKGFPDAIAAVDWKRPPREMVEKSIPHRKCALKVNVSRK